MGMFYINVEQNLENYSSYNQMENEYYDKFMNKLNKWIPRNCGSLEEG